MPNASKKQQSFTSVACDANSASQNILFLLSLRPLNMKGNIVNTVFHAVDIHHQNETIIIQPSCPRCRYKGWMSPVAFCSCSKSLFLSFWSRKAFDWNQVKGRMFLGWIRAESLLAPFWSRKAFDWISGGILSICSRFGDQVNLEFKGRMSLGWVRAEANPFKTRFGHENLCYTILIPSSMVRSCTFIILAKIESGWEIQADTGSQTWLKLQHSIDGRDIRWYTTARSRSSDLKVEWLRTLGYS